MATTPKEVKSAAVEFPQALLGEGVKLAKASMKANKSWAELASLCIAESVDWQGLIKFAFITAGGVARDARGTITNASKFVAASIAVRQGKLSAREFASLKTDIASVAFKQAGGMQDGGLDPDKWLEAYRNPTKPETGGGETGGGANGTKVTARIDDHGNVQRYSVSKDSVTCRPASSSWGSM